MLFPRVFRVLSDPLRDRGVDFMTVNIDEKSCYFRVFFVCVSEPLQDRRVDFLTLNLDEKSCYFRVFFACFLTHCETEVLIF